MTDSSTIARPYARAIFDLAREAGELGTWSTALSAAAEIIRDPAARGFLRRPELGPAERARFLTELCAGVDGAALLTEGPGRNFVRLLAENDRLLALEEISAQFEELKTEVENKIRVTLVSATEVDQSVAAKIASALKRKLGRDVDLAVEVDGTLLGGAVIRAKDMVIDGSVQSRLARLAGALID